MRKSKDISRRFASVMLAVLLSITLLPAGAFADDKDTPQGGLNDAGAVLDDGEKALVTDGEEVAQDGNLTKETTDAEEESGGDTDGNGPDLQGTALSVQNVCPPHVIDAAKDYHAQVDATCTQPGTKAYYQCEACHKYFADDAGSQEITDLSIPALGHAWDAGVVSIQDGKIVKIFTCTICGTTKTDVINDGPVGRNFKLDGCKVQFKSDFVQTPPDFMNDSDIDHVWIKAGKTNIKVYWDNADNMNNVDGVVILRATGKQKVFKEVGRISFRKSDGSYKVKKAYNDKTAKKKNTPYTYRVVTYCVRDDCPYISHISDWAAGQTTKSRLKSVYKAKINKTKANLQYGDGLKLSLKYSSPGSTYNSKSFRWYSDNPKVASVNKKGKVKAKAPGTTMIRGRLSSGQDITCKVKIVGAFAPGAPTLKVDVASNSSISLKWNSTKYADNYDLYRSDDGLHWQDPIRVNGTSKKVTGLEHGHRYTFYVVARNENGPYTAVSKNSNVVNQKAVVKRRPTKVSGWPTSKTLISNESYTMKISVTTPTKRKASLQMKSGGKWVTKKTVTLPKGAGKATVYLYFPNDWWQYKTSKWRLYIPSNDTSEEYTSPTLTITSARVYQNPSGYVQISNTISKHGYSYYVSPVLINSASTRSDCIEALIRTANKYKGSRYKQGGSETPGGGVDESGLIIQSCYGAGVDLWPISPATRPFNCVTEIQNKAKLKSITFKDAPEGSNNYPTLTRGDLIFFTNKNGYTVHAGIYLGYGNIIHASPVEGVVETATIRELLDPYGKYGYDTSNVYVRRIFN